MEVYFAIREIWGSREEEEEEKEKLKLGTRVFMTSNSKSKKLSKSRIFSTGERKLVGGNSTLESRA